MREDQARALGELLRRATRERICSNGSGTEVRAIESKPVAEGSRWRSWIPLSNSALQLRFEIAYSASVAKALAAAASGKTAATVGESLARDYMNEFCNLTAGLVKKAFGEQGIELVIGLPRAIEPYSPWPLGQNGEAVDSWKLDSKDFTVLCVSSSRVLDAAALGGMDPECLRSYTEADSIEIL